MKVLVVEDDEFTRTLLTGALTSLGHDCIAAVDGLHGWSHVQTGAPDMVISDWQMPGLDGLQLHAKVRELDGAPLVSFLLMTPDRETALSALGDGVDDYLVKPVDLEDLEARVRLAERSLATRRELEARRDELEVLRVELRESAERDPLTKVYNRLRLTDDVRAVEDRVVRYGHAYAIALLDIDHFRSYNDTYGHVAGDEALIHVATTIAGHARAGDGVYRYGGGQFLVLLPEQSPGSARVAAERIREAVADARIPHAHLQTSGRVTVSVGIAGLAGDADTFAAALQRAETAVADARRGGRNRTVVAPAGIGPDAQRT